MFNITSKTIRGTPLQVDFTINRQRLTMETDTGDSLSIISGVTYHQLWPRENTPQLGAAKMVLHIYTGEQVSVRGTVNVEVGCQDQKLCISLVVVKRDGPSFTRWDWLKLLKFNWADINHIHTLNLEALMKKHSQVFSEDLDTLAEFTWIQMLTMFL